MVYMIITPCKDKAYIKIGYASNIAERIKAYKTHNPNAYILHTAKTYKKTKYHKETQSRQQLEALGCARINGTEWHGIEYDDPFLHTLIFKGFNALQCFNGVDIANTESISQVLNIIGG